MRVERLHNLVARLHALPRRRLTLLVGVDGLAGSGKTTFTRALAALDPGLDVIEMSDFGLTAGAGEQPGGEAAGRPGVDADWRRLRSTVLLPLTRDQAARYQRYDPTANALAEWRVVPVGGIVIVEGRFSCVKSLATFYDFRIWVECAPEIRHRRLIGAGGVESRAEQAWLPPVEAYGDSQAPQTSAHLRVDGSGLTAHDPGAVYVRLTEARRRRTGSLQPPARRG